MMVEVFSRLFHILSIIKKGRLLHFFYGSLIALFIILFFGAWWAMLIVLLAGAFKEVVDYLDHGEVEARDMFYTVLGGVVVCLPQILGG